ncbi:MAG: hypothetical protein J6C07_08910 [Lachnospiraceae bacterium]|nr:hypothetical protein [Lachnospiraceae bacterium]
MATNMKKKLICFLLTFALGLVPAAAQAGSLTAMAAKEPVATVTDWKETHKKIAENSKFNLYVCEDDLSLVVEDKATGHYMESSPSYDDGANNKTWQAYLSSAIVITYIQGNTDTKQADLVKDNVNKKITYTDNGFEAELYWTKYKFGVTLKVELTEDGLKATVPDSSIIENSDTYIGTLAIYPCMGVSYLDQKEGYMFIPDGNGALIYLEDNEKRFNTGYSSMIYGDDIGFTESSVANLLWGRYEMLNDQNLTIAPVYGIAHTDDELAYLAIVEDGAERATIEAQPNGVNVQYNRAYAKFLLRKRYTQPTSNNSTSGSFHLVEADRSHSDLTVRFLFLTGEDANYCGMANAYRDYLLDRGDLVVQEDNSYRTRIDFLGTEREEFLIGTKAVAMTTVEDIYGIYEDLAGVGVTDLFSLYKGWQKGGLYDLPITSYKADKNIGSTKELTQLIKDAESKNISFYLYNEALRINPDEQNATFNVVKKVNKKVFEESTYKEVYSTFRFLTPTRSNTLLNKFAKSYTKQGVDNIALAGITNNLFTYTYSNVPYTRFQAADTYVKAVEELDASTDLVMEEPFAYLWKNTKAFLDMPVYMSNYLYEDESVPFLSIVLKGVMPVYADYVNFEANKEEFFLKLVETGSYPSFYITKESAADLIYTNSSDIYSSQYDVYKDEIIQYTNELKAVYDAVAGAVITGHKILDNGVRIVTYSNGTQIYLNYSSAAQTVDGVSIDTMSYKVVGANE